MEGEHEPEETPEEVVISEQHIPTHEERLEHCYDEIRQLRAEIAELRSHSHPELAHSVHEHDRYAEHDHKHPVEDNAEHTGEPTSSAEPSGERSPAPSSKHPYFKKVDWFK